MLRADIRQLGLQLTGTRLGASERLLELAGSGLLGCDNAVELVGALDSALRLGA